MLARRSLLLIAILVATIPTHAQQFKLLPGTTDSDGLPTSGAKFCLNGPLFTCYPMSSMTQGDVTFDFGLDPHATAIAKPGPGPWILFEATFSGGGSGTLTRYDIIRSEDTYLVSVLANVALTNQSDHAIWHEPRLSQYPLFVTADFLWDFHKKETHFAHHFYTIHVYRYDPNEREYFSVLTYKTRHKYRGLDDTDKINILHPERPEIVRRLYDLHLKP
jgi:hypothetical protein